MDLNKRLVELGARYSAKFVATNDVHYIEQTDAKYQDMLLAIQTGTLLSDPDRMRYEDPSYYLRSPQEMSRCSRKSPNRSRTPSKSPNAARWIWASRVTTCPSSPCPKSTRRHLPAHLCEQGAQHRFGDRADDPKSANGSISSWASSTTWASTPTS